MYGMICQSEIQKFTDKDEISTMLTAAIYHDIEHPGYHNAYQVHLFVWIYTHSILHVSSLSQLQQKPSLESLLL